MFVGPGLSVCGPLNGPCYRCLLWIRGCMGSVVKLWSFIWPEDPCCTSLVKIREFVGACGLWFEGVFPHIA